MRALRGISTITFLTILFTGYISGYGASPSVAFLTATPTIQTDIFGRPQVFHEILGCSKMETTGQGLTWQGIGVGISKLSELEKLLAPKYELYSRDGELSVFRLRDDIPIDTNVPDKIRVCSRNDIIFVISISTIYYAGSVPLSDFVKQYGTPDAVAWSHESTRRIVFWLRYGVGLEVYVNRFSPDFGGVLQIIYFPYQKDIQSYEMGWPYSETWPSESTVSEEGAPHMQNPFDFATMQLTIAAQPSHTTTSTFIPEPKQTDIPTVTPGSTR